MSPNTQYVDEWLWHCDHHCYPHTLGDFVDLATLSFKGTQQQQAAVCKKIITEARLIFWIIHLLIVYQHDLQCVPQFGIWLSQS